MSSSATPLVLAGITTRNRADILSKAIESLLNQSYANLAIRVIDDASDDATPALRERFPTVRWVRRKTPQGYMENRNELMRDAGADYYLSLDDDAWFINGDEIACAISHLQANPSLGGIAFDILSPDRPTSVKRTNAVPVSLFIGCGHVLRLQSVQRAGYYAPVPGTYGSEEKDLCLRLADLGYGIDLLPGVHVWHEKAWAGRDNRPLHRSGVCNEMVMTLRRCPAPDFVIVIPLKVVSYLWFWLRHPVYFFAGLRGLMDFVYHSAGAWRTRQPVKRTTFWRRPARNAPVST